jgi:hypothetical protein
MNAHEDAARSRKAAKIAARLRTYGWADRLTDVADMDPTQRALVAEAAGVKPPSDATWSAVVAILARTPEPEPVDPFALLDQRGAM